MTARTKVTQALILVWRTLRVLLIVGAGVAAGWATWSLYQPASPCRRQSSASWPRSTPPG